MLVWDRRPCPSGRAKLDSLFAGGDREPDRFWMARAVPKRFGYQQVRGCAVHPIALSGATEKDLVALEPWPAGNEITKLIPSGEIIWRICNS